MDSSRKPRPLEDVSPKKAQQLQKPACCSCTKEGWRHLCLAKGRLQERQREVSAVRSYRSTPHSCGDLEGGHSHDCLSAVPLRRDLAALAWRGGMMFSWTVQNMHLGNSPRSQLSGPRAGGPLEDLVSSGVAAGALQWPCCTPDTGQLDCRSSFIPSSNAVLKNTG